MPDQPAGVPATVVIAKAPRPGHVKTRLIPPLTPEQAAMVAGAALADTLAAVAGCPGRAVIALDGPAPEGVPERFEVIAQGGGGLGDRLQRVIDMVGKHGSPVIVVAMDTPQVTVELLSSAHKALAETDAVLGPSVDGGYWLVGLRQPVAQAFAGVTMSVESTYVEQVARFADLGLRVGTLDVLRDVDTIDDARAVAADFPDTQFARAFGAVT